jgi:hypothetical protein
MPLAGIERHEADPRPFTGADRKQRTTAVRQHVGQAMEDLAPRRERRALQHAGEDDRND